MASSIDLEMTESKSEGKFQADPLKSPIVENDLNLGCMRASKERGAWYCFDVGNSLFGGFAVVFLIPLLLTDSAAQVAYTGYKFPQKCYDINVTCTNVTCLNTTSSEQYKGECLTCDATGNGERFWGNNGTTNMTSYAFLKQNKQVPFFGTTINYISYTTYIISISVILQAIVFISIGPFADYGRNRKQILLGAAAVSWIACASFLAAEDKDSAYIILGILTIIANVFYGLSVVAYNAFLPVLVDAHERLCAVSDGDSSADEVEKFRVEHESEVSSKGYIYGYIGQIVGMVLGGGLYFVGTKTLDVEDDYKRKSLAIRIAVTFVALWWMLWTIPSLLWLKNRPSPPMPIESRNPLRGIQFAWLRIWSSLCQAWKYKNTWRFLALYFCYSDMHSTITYVGVLVAKEKLCMDMLHLMVLLLIVVLSSVVGGYSTLYYQRWTNCSVKSIIVGSLICYALLSVWGFIGALNKTIGLRKPWEMYLFGFIHGFVLGPLQSYSRTLFADFIPAGHESSFFSLYAITDKGSSWLGPLIIGVVADSDIDLRYGCLYLLVMSLVPAILLIFFVDHSAGMKDVGRKRRDSDIGNDMAESSLEKEKGASK